jgi:hypothetical protein
MKCVQIQLTPCKEVSATSLVNAMTMLLKRSFQLINKVAYKLFMEEYNSKNFIKTVEIANSMHNVEAKYVKQYYDYQKFRSEEEKVTHYEIISEYRRNCKDPSRLVAQIEKKGGGFRSKNR